MPNFSCDGTKETHLGNEKLHFYEPAEVILLEWYYFSFSKLQFLYGKESTFMKVFNCEKVRSLNYVLVWEQKECNNNKDKGILSYFDSSTDNTHIYWLTVTNGGDMGTVSTAT